MPSHGRHSAFRACSVCEGKVPQYTSKVLLNSRYTGWHRSYRLCARCTRVWDQLFKLMRENVK